MEKLNKDKSNDMPFYFSDMLGYTSAKRSTHVVENPSSQYFALATPFDLTKLKNISDESLIIQKEILTAFLKFTNPEKKEATAFLDKIG